MLTVSVPLDSDEQKNIRKLNRKGRLWKVSSLTSIEAEQVIFYYYCHKCITIIIPMNDCVTRLFDTCKNTVLLLNKLPYHCY